MKEGTSSRRAFGPSKQATSRRTMKLHGRNWGSFCTLCSHSNWVELGNTLPNPRLIRSDVSIGNLADVNRATCRSCEGDDCTNNILEDIIEEQVLTSGYFGIVPVLSTKPPGKCSHGGGLDVTSKIEPIGGINKDTFSSNHGHLHTQAANMAIAATSQLLEDIRSAAGDRPFLQMMGMFKGSSKALCFVIDTTSSMSEDIQTVQDVTSAIINSEVGTDNEPSVYILVPFNDPDFGPLIKTTDPKVFKDVIDSLQASGGGDEEELSLSGLQLALSSAPFSSEIFLFTDAPAKDKQLKNTVIALIERTQTMVTFFITDSSPLNSRRRRNANLLSRMSASDTQLYKDLAQASGSLAIEVTKSDLPRAATIITESASSSLVTLLQAVRNPGKKDSFTFIVDQTVSNVRVYITGTSVTFTITSPTGVSQQSTSTTGSLITSSQSVGNFRSLQLTKIKGSWQINMNSNDSYTLKVIGESPIDFLFDFVAPSQGVFSGFDALETRPRAGVNGGLLVTLTGSSTATVTNVTLVTSSGSEQINGVVESQGSGNFLVQVDRVPSDEFVVRVKGKDQSNVFQRQSTTNFRASNVTITADSSSILEPGSDFSVTFSLTTNGPDGNFTIRATNNRRFASTFPTSLLLENGTSANGTVMLSAPLNTPSGTDVTLTIEAEAPGGGDSNYIVLRFSVVNTVTDFTAPVCELLSLQSNCSDNCSSAMWDLSVRVSDGNDGTGVERVTLRQGGGMLNTSLEAGNENVTLASYTSSCCSPEAELLVVDRVGNVGTCAYNIREGSVGAQSSSTRTMLSMWLYLSLIILGLHVVKFSEN
ncbi:von Willebrand factor A domain-containing protein 7-like isoform X2 [Gouania willdenowi]|uniref:von Willebrand factor A domain-containing protein 7-like isoform X2 n=1 Tax=Gouania willdenowi TaxID=441366 RepID=UPI001055DDB2|nr:von Willebrand factor A domain-containing protein 7-like isoform X2 [Gouania willdenowi]